MRKKITNTIKRVHWQPFKNVCLDTFYVCIVSAIVSTFIMGWNELIGNIVELFLAS